MKDKCKEDLLACAAALDAAARKSSRFTTVTQALLRGDRQAVRTFVSLLGEVLKSFAKDERVVQIVKAAKKNVALWLGLEQLDAIIREKGRSHAEEQRSLEDWMNDLNQLIGLDRVKRAISDLVAYQHITMLRERQGLKAQRNTLHMAFTGNPGTGKTTVARIVGGIYCRLGLLSKGHFTEVSRTDLIAGYQGQTALKVKDVVQRARGGVLFIDEAYSITENQNSDSYGRECLTELTKALEDYREDLVVIVAGYTVPMHEFFESNPGLRSRFNTFIEFDNYSSAEMALMLYKMCQDNDYQLCEEGGEMLNEYLQEHNTLHEKEFANGRFVRNLYDDLVMAQARRLNGVKHLTREKLQQITRDDFSTVLAPLTHTSSAAF